MVVPVNSSSSFRTVRILIGWGIISAQDDMLWGKAGNILSNKANNLLPLLHPHCSHKYSSSVVPSPRLQTERICLAWTLLFNDHCCRCVAEIEENVGATGLDQPIVLTSSLLCNRPNLYLLYLFILFYAEADADTDTVLYLHRYLPMYCTGDRRERSRSERWGSHSIF